jgi:predicted membrane GTPase involved in stress response
MIDSFYMLSDADKEDVQNNIDKYSVEQIEEKLAVICVRNKLDMSGADRSAEVDTTFNLNNDDDDANESVPALVSALRKAKRNN